MSNKDAIAKLRAEADALEAADKAFNALPEDQRLAITLHSLLCHWNHVDGCGWEYEGTHNWEGRATHDWNGHAHSRYLAKAHKMLACCKLHKISGADAIEILKIAQD